ncbi:MAG: TolB-like protein [Rhodothermales bacterium]|jgi:TolB-like protein
MTSVQHMFKRISAAMQAGLCVAMLLLLSASVAYGQNGALDEAAEVYHSADFDRAIEMFSHLADHPDSDIETKKACFQYLGRSFVAKHMEDEAREAIRQLLELAKPMVELNPDAEPPPLMDLYYEVRTALHGYEAQSDLQTMAVIDFTNGSVGPDASDYDALSLGLSSMMINFLGGASDLHVVERERLSWLLSELDLQGDDNRVDQATAVKAGKLLGAQTVLIGSFIVNGKDMYVGTRLVSVETGEVLFGEQLFGRQRDIFDLVQKLSVQTTQAIGVVLDAETAGSTHETHSLDAMMSYSEGLALLEHESYSEAYQKFVEALDHDPTYSRAELRMESLKTMLD